MLLSFGAFAGCGQQKEPEPKAAIDAPKEEPAASENPEKELITTNLYDDLFLYFSENIGKVSFEDAVNYINQYDYSVDIQEETDAHYPSIRVYDGTTFSLHLTTYPDETGQRVVHLVTYRSAGVSVCTTNNANEGPIEYRTYNMDRETENIDVSSIEELTSYIFGEGKAIQDAYDSVKREIIQVELDAELKQNEDGSASFAITTNLPDDTSLMLSLDGPENYRNSEHVTIKDGSGTSPDFTKQGAALPSGSYQLVVSMSVPILQEDSVRAIVGNGGEFLEGDCVRESNPGGTRSISKEFSFEIN